MIDDLLQDVWDDSVHHIEEEGSVQLPPFRNSVRKEVVELGHLSVLPPDVCDIKFSKQRNFDLFDLVQFKAPL